jgi:hypothetical protein
MPPGRKKNVTPTHLRKIKHLTCHATRFRARQEGFLQRSLGWHQSLMPLRSRRIFGGLPGDKSFNVPSPGLERRTRLVGEVVAFRRCRGVIDVILVTLDQMPSKRAGVVGFQIASAAQNFGCRLLARGDFINLGGKKPGQKSKTHCRRAAARQKASTRLSMCHLGLTKNSSAHIAQRYFRIDEL